MESYRSIYAYFTPTANGDFTITRPASMEDPARHDEVMILVAGELDSMRESGAIDCPELLRDEDLARHEALIEAGAREPDWHEFYFALTTYQKEYPRQIGSTRDPELEAIKRVRMKVTKSPEAAKGPKEYKRMTQEARNTERVWCLKDFDRVLGPEDLVPRRGINLNPPPSDGRCDCCGTHISEVTPFGGSGDPLVGDFSGALLIKKFRPCGPYNEKAVRALKKAEERCKTAGHQEPLQWMVAKWGVKRGERLYHKATDSNQVVASWECRNCVVLGRDKYFQIRRRRYREWLH